MRTLLSLHERLLLFGEGRVLVQCLLVDAAHFLQLTVDLLQFRHQLLDVQIFELKGSTTNTISDSV
jgi:hypothetical protein